MLITYEDFVTKLNAKIKSDDEFYFELLVTVIKNPHRYTGVFRLSNVQTKLVQNVTQSREIKFGDFMEEIVTEYIQLMGYENISKNIGTDEEGNALSADQVFMKNDTVYLIEQKIRDDHDSTKKRGQYQNFQKKYNCLKNRFPRHKVVAAMWFIDDSLVKNKNYYTTQANAESEALDDVNIFILYGSKLFTEIFDRIDVWNEIYSYLQRNKLERDNTLLEVPNFDTSEEMLFALKRLKLEQKSLYKKLVSNHPAYVQLRAELFPSGVNIRRVL